MTTTQNEPFLEEESFETLRNLLLQPEQEHLDDLESRILDPDRLAAHVSRALPMAVRRSHSENTLLARAFTPLIEAAIEKSIRKNPKLMAEILFPVIGRSVRKAVSETWHRLLQQLNQMLETRLSARSFKWRWIAWRTGKSYVEVVLAHTLLFRVEQVFLIHRETGLLLHHLGRGDELVETEVVSSMFTAIVDFVQDSFHLEEGAALEGLRLGELQVWVTPGPHAYLAAVIRGHPPEDLRQTLQHACEEVHFDYAAELTDFSGETERFEGIDSLADCLQSREQEQTKKRFNPLYALTALVIVAGLSWLTYLWTVQSGDQAWIRARLAQEPGYWLTDLRFSQGHYLVEGLQDPLALPLAEVMAEKQLRYPAQGQFMPIHSLEPSLMLARLRHILDPPPDVTLTISDGILLLQGRSSHAWLAGAREKIALMPGFDQWDDSNLETEPPPDPIAETVAWLEAWTLYFEPNQSEPDETGLAQMATLVPQVHDLFQTARQNGMGCILEISGYSDNLGLPTRNKKISAQRARFVAEFLIAAGIAEPNIQTIGHGTANTTQEENKNHMRRVTLTVRCKRSP